MVDKEFTTALLGELKKRERWKPITFGELADILRSLDGSAPEVRKYEDGFPKRVVRQPKLSGYDTVDRAPGVPETKTVFTSAEYNVAVREGFREE
jgi:hypothetical protein